MKIFNAIAKGLDELHPGITMLLVLLVIVIVIRLNAPVEKPELITSNIEIGYIRECNKKAQGEWVISCGNSFTGSSVSESFSRCSKLATELFCIAEEVKYTKKADDLSTCYLSDGRIIGCTRITSTISWLTEDSQGAIPTIENAVINNE